MIADSGIAKIASSNGTTLDGGDFETAKGDQARGWDFQDEPGKASFIDRTTVQHGKQSLRFENLAKTNAPSGNGRISKKIKVAPWRQMHASVWIKTSDFYADDIRLIAIDGTGRTLVHSHLGVQPNQDWTLHHAVFNTFRIRRFSSIAGRGRKNRHTMDGSNSLAGCRICQSCAAR